jgi:hypothetical protein
LTTPPTTKTAASPANAGAGKASTAWVSTGVGAASESQALPFDCPMIVARGPGSGKTDSAERKNW